MEQLESRIDTGSPEFQERSRAMAALVDGLRQELERAREGGAGRARHAEQKKMFVRDRVDALLDAGLAVPRALAPGGPRDVRRRGARRAGSSPGSGGSRAGR